MAFLFAGCFGGRHLERPPDDRFGHRYDGVAPDGRRTLDVTPADTATRFFYYPAFIDSVHFRPAPFTSEGEHDDRVPVEVLLKGSIPDACMELHDVRQERFGHIVEMRIDMRRPQGAVCAAVRRPFRLYLELEGTYAPGSYTLRINDRVFSFAVRR